MSLPWRLVWSGKSEKQLDGLPAQTRQRVGEAIRKLEDDPLSSRLDVRPVKSRPGYYRLRVGNYRVIFQRDDDERLLRIMVIKTRGDVYGKRITKGR